jgi:ATP-independent RNA helicase DbpA
MESSDLTNFSDIGLITELLQVTTELGYTSMTSIQSKTIPLALQGLDILGQAQTGSGKTVAFALPALQKIYLDQKPRALKVLILAPTRELCTQIAREIRKLGRHFVGLRVVELVGGQPLPPQISALEQGVDIAVATPGRMMDLIGRSVFPANDIQMVVLDEADRMLEMGFVEDIESILSTLPEERQILMFSATFPDKIVDISNRFQSHGKTPCVRMIADVVPEELKGQSRADLKEYYYVLDSSLTKTEALIRMLCQYQPQSVVVFCNFKIQVADLTRDLNAVSISAVGIHGDLEQSERDRVMAQFRNQSARVLVATDVAARGIHVDAVQWVINYELPKQSEVYVHRIGRAGRLNSEGSAQSTAWAIAMITPLEQSKINWIETETGHVIQPKDFELKATDFQPMPAFMRTLYISGGRKNKVRPGDILGALTGDAGGFKGEEIGKIEIHDYFSYVAIRHEIAKKAMTTLQNGRIKGRKFRVEPLRDVKF